MKNDENKGTKTMKPDEHEIKKKTRTNDEKE